MLLFSLLLCFKTTTWSTTKIQSCVPSPEVQERLLLCLPSVCQRLHESVPAAESFCSKTKKGRLSRDSLYDVTVESSGVPAMPHCSYWSLLASLMTCTAWLVPTPLRHAFSGLLRGLWMECTQFLYSSVLWPPKVCFSDFVTSFVEKIRIDVIWHFWKKCSFCCWICLSSFFAI